MHTEQKKNREWVKTAAIIFLLLMLVLTFFSNTIMNRTLPEVASTNVTSGTITAKVRGTGTVSAISTNEVKADATRYVDTVKVKEGQEVSAGDVLFIMGEGESEELEAAQDTLDALGWSLKRTEANYPTNYNASGAYSLNSSAYNMASAQAEVDRILSGSGYPKQAEIDAAYKAYLEAANALAWFNEWKYEPAQKLWKQNKTAAENNYLGLQEDYYNKLANVTDQDQEYFLPESGIPYDNMLAAQYEYEQALATPVLNPADEAEFYRLQAEMESAEAYYNQLLAEISTYDSDLAAAMNKLNSAQGSYYSAYDSYYATADAYSKSASIHQIDVAEATQNLEKAQAKVDKLSGNGNNVVVAKTNGIVSTVEVAAGDKVPKGTIMATNEVPDMGYQMSFSATLDQAKRLKVGDTATISNYYWGSDIIATVSSIKTDPKSPQTKKLITCDLDGNLTAGSELTVSIGQKSATYEMIVPNNSVKTDSNGTFVLVINSKNSPLGNRYFASRVDVEVLAQDDVNSAVTGGLNAGDFVITTSSAPIKSGDQIRMADQ